jgi:hypothetical protein
VTFFLVSFTRGQTTSLFLKGKTGQVDCMVFFTTYQIFKMKFTSGVHGAQTIQNCPTAMVIHEEHENRE